MKLNENMWRYRGVVVNMLVGDIKVSELDVQSRYYIYVWKK